MILILALVSALGVVYYLWTVNADLRYSLRVEETKNEVLREARVKDALAAKQLIEAMHTEQSKLLGQLHMLGGIQDAEGRNYLDTVVPVSVIELFTR